MMDLAAEIWNQIAKLLRNLLSSLSGAFNLASARRESSNTYGLTVSSGHNSYTDKERQKRTEAELRVLNFKIVSKALYFMRYVPIRF